MRRFAMELDLEELDRPANVIELDCEWIARTTAASAIQGKRHVDGYVGIMESRITRRALVSALVRKTLVEALRDATRLYAAREILRRG